MGVVYNDLKLDNILIGDGTSSYASLSQIRMIDFGLITAYLEEGGKHINEEQ